MFDDPTYDATVLPLYGTPRNADTDADLLSRNRDLLPHAYAAPTREDLSMHETYCIDPPGCEDADDAFSIFSVGSKTMLAIHIADPTEWIALGSALWSDIQKRAVTRYPSNHDPIHLMPKELVRRASLDAGEIPKNALTVLSEIDSSTHLPTGRVKLLFSTIAVTQNLTYSEAHDAAGGAGVAISAGLKIAEALATRRARTAPVVRTRQSKVSFLPTGPELVCSDGKIEGMIAEFAIFANSFVAQHINCNLRGVGVFRTCSSMGKQIDSSEFFVEDIISSGIRAEYLAECAAHDLVGATEYCHFTSPIRRLADCVCHYLVRYIALRSSRPELPCPFTNEELDTLSEKCLLATKEVRLIQHQDTKFRLMQTVSAMLRPTFPLPPNAALQLTFFVSDCKFPFLNLIVSKIDDHCVRMPYTLRTKPGERWRYDLNDLDRQIFVVRITRVGPRGRFDEGTLPELDAFAKDQFQL